jgi:hypothetical protein
MLARISSPSVVPCGITPEGPAAAVKAFNALLA